MNFIRTTTRRASEVTKGLRYRALSTTSTTKQIRYTRFESPNPLRNGRRPGSKNKLGPEKFIYLLAGLGGVYYVSHLEQVPDTGRWRFMNISAKTEAQMGQETLKEIQLTMGSQILPPDHPVSRHVRRVVSRILASSNLGTVRGEKRPEGLFAAVNRVGGYGGFSTPDSDFGAATDPNESTGPEKEWEVIVVHDKIANAMTVPGVVVVFTGLLPVCRDEEGLAAVVAHEIGHIVARHPAERMSSQSFLIAGSIMLQVLGIDYILAQGISTYFFELPNSRTQEREADSIGLRLMSRACYNPAAAPAMFERLAQFEKSMGGGEGFEFTRTHPSSESRARLLEQMLPDAQRLVSDNPECEEYQRQLEQFKRASVGIRLDGSGAVYRT